METSYSFGTMKLLGEERRIVRVKSREPIALSGYQTVTETYPDMIVTHMFKPETCVAEDTDMDGWYYKWYTLAEHSKHIDRSPAAVQMVQQSTTNLENALCDLDVSIEERLTILEDALCELDSAINE